MKCVIWGYEYKDMKETWSSQMKWLINALQENNIEVKLKNLKCKDVNLPEYNCKTDNPCDIGIYNHTDESVLVGNVLTTRVNWFFKPTVPDEVHTTLDTLGYGPYSSITYEKPDFENVQVGDFFETKVRKWIDSKITKWGNTRFKEEEIKEKDYWLVVGQCAGDSVVTRHDFGGYVIKLTQVIKELLRVDDRLIIVKLHPHMDGKDATDTVYSDNIKKQIEKISPRIKVYSNKSNIHNFIKNARAVILANSGAGFETMMHHKPIIAWGFPEYHWVTYDLRHLADLKRAIKLDWFDREKQDKFLYWYTQNYCFYDQESCNRRVRELLISLNS